MFDFFEEIIDFLNQLIEKYNYNDLFELSFIRQIVQAVESILNWIRSFNFKPLNFEWVFPVVFLSLYLEWRNRNRKNFRGWF